MYRSYGLYIAGEWRDSSDNQYAPVFSPVTEEAIGEVPIATEADTEEAISSAQRGFTEWKARRIHGRIIESRSPGGRLEVHYEPVGIAARGNPRVPRRQTRADHGIAR